MKDKPIQKKVRSLKDQTLNTGVASYSLVKGEVFIGWFKNPGLLDSLINIGVLERVPDNEKVEKIIPVHLIDKEGIEFPLQAEFEETPLFVEFDEKDLFEVAEY